MSEPFLAEIRIVGFNFAPRGWAFCDGQILPINQNQSLYSLGEVVKLFIVNRVPRQERIALVVHDRDPPPQGGLPVLGTVRMVMPQFLGHHLRLVAPARPV